MRRLFIYTLLILNNIACNNFNNIDSTQSLSVSTVEELEQALTQGKHAVLVNDILLTKGFIISQDANIDLNGNKISANSIEEALFCITNNAQLKIEGSNGSIETDNTIFSIEEGLCLINGGEYYALTNGVGTKSEPYFIVYVKEKGLLQTNNATLGINDNNGGFVGAIHVNEGGQFIGNKTDITTSSQRGITNSITSYGDITLTECSVVALADHTANAAVTDYATTSRPLLIEGGVVRLNNCYTYGMHSGGVIKGELYIDGGQYNGYSHGGLYISNGGKVTQIKGAVIQEAPLADGYIDDGKAGTNHAGVYIGGSNNMKIYIDNCQFYGVQQPIVMKDNAGNGNNSLYISRSSINLDYTHYGVRNDGSSHITFGVGNNFDEKSLKYNRNFTHTEDIYAQ